MKEINKIQNGSHTPEHPDENELARYAEYLRHETDQVPQELIDHVASCSYCRAELMAISDMLDALPDLAEEPMPSPFIHPSTSLQHRTSASSQWLRAAATIAAIFLLAWIVQQLLPDRHMNEPVASNASQDSTSHLSSDSLKSNLLTNNLLSSDSITTDSSLLRSALPDTIRYAEAYIPNPVFENLVEAKYRSGSDPKVKGPDPYFVFAAGDTLNFSWTPDPEDTYVLVVLDNKANPVKEIKTGSEGYLSWKADLKPGLYYWKFLGREEMWKVGKLKIITTK